MRERDLERLYVRMERPLYNVVYRWIWKPEEARDIVQEAFVRLWRMRERIEAATVEPLVYRIALNLASSRRRSARLWRWVSLEALRETGSRAAGADDALATDERKRLVREAIEALPEELRRVVMLCEYSELSYDEIASVLSIPAGTVASRRHRALVRLRKRLSKEIGADERPSGETV